MVLELKCTDTVGNSLNRILNRMCEIVHRIDAPLIACIMVCHMSHSVDYRVSHIHIGRRHIYSGSEDLGSILIFALLHLLKELQILFNTSVPAGVVLTGLCQGTAVFANLLCA